MLSKDVLKNKLNKDILWTIISFIILGISGIGTNSIITYFKNTAYLGAFTYTYAVYSIFAEIGVIGIHLSVLNKTAVHIDNEEKRRSILSSAVVMSILSGFIVFVILYITAPFFANFIEYKKGENLLKFASFSLLLFPLNKVLNAYVNGLREIKTLAILNSLRYISILFFILFVVWREFDFEKASLCFFATELLVLGYSLLYLVQNKFRFDAQINKEMVAEHLNFGLKSYIYGILFMLNSRVDTLLISVLIKDDSRLGVYGFASTLLEGIMRLLISIRLNINPMLVHYFRDNEAYKVNILLNKFKKNIYIAAAVISVGVLIFYYIIAHYLMPTKNLDAGLPILSVLLLCVTLVAPYLPFDHLMLTANKPFKQSQLYFLVTLSNIVLNLLLIPIFGLMGAAIATGLSIIVSVLILNILSTKYLGVNLMAKYPPSV